MKLAGQNECFLPYEGRHSGETIYIIGNGPSLADTDLSLIQNCPSIAMNRISLLYPKFNDWRPTYYLFCSSNISNPIWGNDWESSVSEAVADPRTISFVDSRCIKFLQKRLSTLPQNINEMVAITENKPRWDGELRPDSFSSDIVSSVDKSGSTINVALQIAFYMNPRRIIFLGTDLGWTVDNGSKHDRNHFMPNYRAHIPDPVKTNFQMRNVHILAKKNFDKKTTPTDIFNASICSKLDVYPIIDFVKFARGGDVVEDIDAMKEAIAFWQKLKPENKIRVKLRRRLFRFREKLAKWCK
jgi:hypothetical protein